MRSLLSTGRQPAGWNDWGGGTNQVFTTVITTSLTQAVDLLLLQCTQDKYPLVPQCDGTRVVHCNSKHRFTWMVRNANIEVSFCGGRDTPSLLFCVRPTTGALVHDTKTKPRKAHLHQSKVERGMVSMTTELRGGIRKFVSLSCRCLVLCTEAIDMTTVRIS